MVKRLKEYQKTLIREGFNLVYVYDDRYYPTDLVELIMAFEEEFGVEIPDDAAETILTVQNAIDYINSKQ